MRDLVPEIQRSRLLRYLGEAQTVLARAFQAQGRLVEAREAFTAARENFQQLGSRFGLWEVLADLAELEAEMGDEQAALTHRREAGQMVEFIIAHLAEPELRAAFLDHPSVRDLPG